MELNKWDVLPVDVNLLENYSPELKRFIRRMNTITLRQMDAEDLYDELVAMFDNVAAEIEVATENAENRTRFREWFTDSGARTLTYIVQAQNGPLYTLF
jgi:DNA-directed RNA polymerase specialized sigma24 family protein